MQRRHHAASAYVFHVCVCDVSARCPSEVVSAHGKEHARRCTNGVRCVSARALSLSLSRSLALSLSLSLSLFL
jgi:hypothetical protein